MEHHPPPTGFTLLLRWIPARPEGADVFCSCRGAPSPEPAPECARHDGTAPEQFPRWRRFRRSAMGLRRENDHQFSLGRAGRFKFDERRDRFRQRHGAADLWDEFALFGRLRDACHTLRCWITGCQFMLR